MKSHIKLNFLWTIFALVLSYGEGLSILGLFPHPGASHHAFFEPILRGLAEAGHEVTVISHFPSKSPTMNYKDLPLTGVSTLNDSVDLQLFEKMTFYNHFMEFFFLYQWGIDACEHMLKSKSLNIVLKSGKKYDVILAEAFNSDCMFGIAHYLKAPVIALSSSAMMPWHYDMMGNPAIPSYVPALFLGQSEVMNFFQRLGNWITTHGMNILYRQYSDRTATALLRHKFGNDMPEIHEIARETSLFFVNQHFSLSGAKPLSPSVIELGGIHIQKPRPLDVEIKRILDSAEHGVVYISWGSMIRANSLPIEKRDAILRAIGRLKQKVLWKWENETLPNQPHNVFIKKWMPQREILCHPNVKVFLSHGGLMGSSEAAYCGVPVVVTPMYGDQYLNAAALIHRGMAEKLSYQDITESTVFKAIKKVLEPSYLENAKAVSFSFRHRPKAALETAIWWVEYVAKTEGAILTKSVSTYLSAFVYYSLDIYLFFASIFLLTILSWIWVIRHFCCKKNKSNKVKEN